MATGEQVAHDAVNPLSMSARTIDDIATNITVDSAGQAPTQTISDQGQQQNNDEGEQREDGNEQHAPGASVSNSDHQTQRDTEATNLENATANSEATEAAQNESAANAAALADASGGSDTDNSRTEAADLALGPGLGHVRSNSVKKPTTFKSVSVTKNFLAKSAVAAPSVRSAGGDKGPAAGPSPTQAAVKPRLVAKSALGGAGSRSGLMKPNGGSGPDASKVWNKNRPVPPPPPRQFTDEELQTRYGIHLATRLQSDEAGKDPKWADIDDDEDDWAPDQVEWMDGTKSSVPTAEAQPSPAPDEKKDPLANEAPGEAVKQILTPMQKSQAPLSVKTILKPGVPVTGNQPKTGGLVLKGAPEKPTLVAKTPAGPSKSPWAPLPPVDKVPPVVINPPVLPQQQSRFQRDPHGFDALGPAPSPAKEIAADDFSRSWRDDRGSKELFNSHSGRYEPVTEARRGSRQEHGHRQPAVLQRPSHGGPAEPSAAFQTSRSGEAQSWTNRRRASSNLSGGSAGRRPSLGRLSDMAARPEIAEGVSPVNSSAIESPRLSFANVDHTQQGQQPPWTQRPQQGATEPQQPAGPASDVVAPVNGEVQPPAVPYEDHHAKMQQLMKEKIDRAKQQKQREREAEEQEKAARAERLKLKMAALATSTPSPNLNLKDSKANEAQVSTKSPKQQQRLTPAASPPKPPVPTSAGEVAQYGMMKVHQPQPVRKNITEALLTGKSSMEQYTDGASTSRRSGSPVKPVTRATPSSQPQQRNPAVRIPKPLPETLPEQSTNGPWKSPSPSESYNWVNKPMNAHSVPSGNVWGPPTREKALGNGTFEVNSTPFSHPNYNRSTGTIGTHGPPGPIAPPPSYKKSLRAGGDLNSNTNFSASQNSSVHSSSSHNASLANNLSASQHQSSPALQHQSSQASQHSSSHASQQPSPHASQHPSLQASQHHSPRESSLNPLNPHQAPSDNMRLSIKQQRPAFKVKAVADIASWNSLSATIVAEEKIKNEKIVADYDAKKALEAATIAAATLAVAQQPVAPVTAAPAEKVDSFVRTVRDANGKRIKIETTLSVRGEGGKPVDSMTFKGIVPTEQLRNSRFFPKEQPEMFIDFNAPPPPEGADHPVWGGAGSREHPIVSLPAPKPTVRLPGRDSAPPTPMAVSFPAQSAPAMARPIVQSVDWNQRFTNLFHPDAQMAGVNSASKAPLAHAAQQGAIRVSVPPKKHVFAAHRDTSSSVISKTHAEDVVFDAPGFGSKPDIKLTPAGENRVPLIIAKHARAASVEAVTVQRPVSPPAETIKVALTPGHETVYKYGTPKNVLAQRVAAGNKVTKTAAYGNGNATKKSAHLDRFPKIPKRSTQNFGPWN
ncbi:hypothetical protein EJ08DRAFT_664240 [Tothia fuscella]|uniref:Uncharacterized protein n=1 Tax=Tothia fuscella TaxID=1048955 RepID=A0A9P4TU00_9PEZI|nr:hypothetical protein EJ08DRAFT_664240 [Tothia fuscella]